MAPATGLNERVTEVVELGKLVPLPGKRTEGAMGSGFGVGTGAGGGAWVKAGAGTGTGLGTEEGVGDPTGPFRNFT